MFASRMKPALAATFVTLFCWTGSASASLIDFGSGGEYFYDNVSGLYWYDPVQFEGLSRPTIDAFVVASSNWDWASSAQINGLLNQSTLGGIPLEDVMGPSQYTLTNGGPRWIGYYAGVSPDGWLVQSAVSPFTTVSDTGFQNGVASWGPGAWLVSQTAPVPEPGTMLLLGSGLLGLVAARRRRTA